MKGSVISDIHIKGPKEKSYRLLLAFLSQKEVKESSTWYFLGDIFDLMVGNHQEYLETFPKFFDHIGEFLKEGGTIHYLEGNHDFHLELLFLNFFKLKNIPSNNFFYHQEAFKQNLNGKSYYFCHGDDIQTGDFGYKFLKVVLRNKVSGFIINKLMSFSLLQKIGVLMSGNSRKYNISKYESDSGQNYVKDRFRKFAGEFLKKNKFDFLICGHSHVIDEYLLKGGKFINIGFPPISKKYLLIDGEEPKFLEII